MNKTMLAILTTSFTLVCVLGVGATMNSGEQGTFIGGLMVGCFWLGWLMKSK